MTAQPRRNLQQFFAIAKTDPIEKNYWTRHAAMAIYATQREIDMQINWNKGVVTVKDNGDGTWSVMIDGIVVNRWPTFDLANGRAASYRSHQK